MKISLKGISIEPLVEGFFVAKMKDEDSLYEDEMLEVVFFLDVLDHVMIERVDETFSGTAFEWEDNEEFMQEHVPYIRKRLEAYIFKHPDALGDMEEVAA